MSMSSTVPRRARDPSSEPGCTCCLKKEFTLYENRGRRAGASGKESLLTPEVWSDELLEVTWEEMERPNSTQSLG